MRITENKTFIEELESKRHYFHAHPELSGSEFQTAKVIVDFLEQCHPTTVLENVGGSGVVGIWDSGNPGPTVMLRSELDALPIEEVNEFDYRSKIEGISHKCGHDGHMTVLLGLALMLLSSPIEKGKVVLLFQPEEENGKGAEAVLADPRFREIEIDYAFAFHNLPGYPLNQIVVKSGPFTAAVISLEIQLQGKTAHAGEPEHGINPALAVAEIIQKCTLLSNNDPESDDFSVVTPVHINMGELAYGISAGEGEIHFTIRTWTQAALQHLSDEIVSIVEEITKRHRIKTAFKWQDHFRANQNDVTAVDFIRDSAKELNFNLKEEQYPFKWGEDFGLFTQNYKGAMFGIGAGEEHPALHNPDYDFPDEMLPVGVRLFYSICLKVLQS